MAEGGVVGVQVDIERVLVIQGVVLPAELDVRDLQGVADGLHGVGAGALGRSEYCDDPQRQLVTGCEGKGGRGQVSPQGICHNPSPGSTVRFSQSRSKTTEPSGHQPPSLCCVATFLPSSVTQVGCCYQIIKTDRLLGRERNFCARAVETARDTVN